MQSIYQSPASSEHTRIKAATVLFLHQQSLDTTTPAGKALFQMMGVFAEFERLEYECPPKVIEEAKAALMAIVEDSEVLVEIKLDALKLLRRVEARKVSPGRAQ